MISPRSAFNLETAVGQARVGCQRVCWQGATPPLATASKKEQRGQRTAWRLKRICSAVTWKVSAAVVKIVHIHGPFQRKERGQLPFLGSSSPFAAEPSLASVRPCPAHHHQKTKSAAWQRFLCVKLRKKILSAALTPLQA
ncbi:MAG: hypothetical protein Q7U52_13210 [Hydrogenophaga sp.]|uniref:hypothetical protein n=1 Tax=Hydrogenophaga sp. TaxID=1904254 RepID=UPI002726CADE|nr:hypothetical protein [Hydrogenophaga sp.]MDO9148592.1 hypothetical protein [Hydrogenophaga sp.]MDO9605459.1 hypothetical protein [Hydrogenophaga sp.]